MKKLVILFIGLVFISCSKDDETSAEQIPSVTIGSQVWMSKNLDVTTYRNGDAIPQVTDPAQWATLTTGAWCYYNNDASNGTTYGKLYNWYAVNDSRGLAPAGWHVPNETEINQLIAFLGGETVAGGKMKSIGLWSPPNSGATGSSGFEALPGGRRNLSGTFFGNTTLGYWWNKTDYDVSNAILYSLLSDDPGIILIKREKQFGFSVRCIKD